MAADSDGDQQNNNNSSTLKAVVICEGNLHDPDFQTRLDCLVAKLTTLVEEPADNGQVKVDKVEPWNSVRVTLSIPKEAAAKLRKLAAEGNSALRALGILSVQLEGDTVLSLRLVGQEIVLRTDNSTPAGPTSSSGASSGLGELTRILSQQQQQQQQQQHQQQLHQQQQQSNQLQHGQQQALPQEPVAGPSKATPPMQPKPSVASVAPVVSTTAPIVNGPIATGSIVFKSPNTICPMDGKLPVHVPNVVESCEYPFESMTQARVIQRRENTLGIVPTTGSSCVPKTPLVSASGSHFVAPNPPPPPPPSYQAAVASAKSGPLTATGSAGINTSGTIGNVAMTSPLLVNLLQNESAIPQIGPKTAPIIKQELIATSGAGISAMKTSVITGAASNSSVVNMINDNELNVNSSSGQNQKISRIATNSSNNPVNPVISNSGSVTVTVAHTISATVISNSVTNTQQTILVNNANNNTGVVPMATGTGSGPTISANANNNLSITTNSSITNNTASNNQNVLNVPPSLVTPPMSVPSSHKNVSVQQQPQPRFNLGPSGAPVIRPSPQQNLRPQLIGVGMVQQQQQELHRPSHQSPQQQTHSQLSLSRFPLQPQQPNAPFRQPQAVQQQQQQHPFNPRWAAPNPMDSVTKSSYQEFTRYQLQYNLSQQQLKHPQQGASNASGDLLGLGDLPDLGKNDLDSLLPALNSADLEGAFLDGLDLDLEQSLAATGGLAKPERRWKQQFLINPLTGELEETQVEETEDNEEDASKSFPEFHSELSNSLYSDDDTSCSTGFSKFTSDISDTERSNTMDGAGSSGFSNAVPGAVTATTVGKLSKTGKVKKEKLKDGTKSSVKNKEKKPREKKSSSLKQVKTKAKIVSTESGGESPGSQETIKLRLKLEKSEAVSVSLIQPHTIIGGVGGSGLNSSKKVQSSQVLGGTPGTLSVIGSISNPSGLNIGSTSLQASLSASSLSSSSSSSVPIGNVMPQQLQHPLSQQVLGSTFTGTNNSAGINTASSSLQSQSPAGEELRVPPLHISLRGKNSVVIKNAKKDRKKSQSGGEEDSDGNSFQMNRKSSIKRSSHSTDSRLTVVMTSDASIRLKVEDSASPGTSGPSSMPSSPNHHNHNSIGTTGSSNSLTTTIAAVAGLKAKSNKMEDLNQPLTANELLVSLDQQHKRSASDSILSPNGIMCPEKKRRLSTGSSTNQQQPGTTDESSISASNSSSSSSSAATSINEINEIYETLISNTVSGPIGSTNVGTLPHSSLLAAATSSAKNLKSSSTNNSINNSAFGKCISNSKNLVKPAQSSPTTSSVSSPGALAVAPNTKSSTQSSSKQPSSSSSSETTKSDKPPGKGDSDLATGDTDGKDNESNKTSSNTATTTSGSDVSINQRINNTHLHHHNRPPEKAGDSPATTLEQSISQQQPPTIASASGHLLAQGVRGSPGSQAQGEDSGIESMDALSEKSPHQLSHSPQGTEPHKPHRMDSPKDKAISVVELKDSSTDDSSGNNNNNSHTNLDEYIQIEAELAKMEGMHDIAVTERTAKLNGDHSTLMKPKQQELDLLDRNALLKYDGANLSKILDDIEDDELIMSEEVASKENCIEMSSSEKSTLQEQQDSTTTLGKGEEAEDWIANAENQQPIQQQLQQKVGDANVILTSNSNNNLMDKADIKLDTKQLVLDDCCSNKEVLSLKSECDSKIVECKAVIKNDPEEAIVSSIKKEQTCNKNSTNNSSNGSSGTSSSSNPEMKVKPVNTAEIESDKQTVNVAAFVEKKDVLPDAAVVEPKPRHEQPPLFSYSSEKARERRSAANFTACSNSSSASVVEIIDLDDSDKPTDLEDPNQPEQQPQHHHQQQQEQQQSLPLQQQNKEIHSPLSIDIPLHPESAEHRIRTRASSKLESPLEPPKQSPSIDSPAAERLKSTLKHAAIPPNLPTPTAPTSSDRLSPKMLPKAGKRKRQGSESSTQSCVSDDILPSRTKKPRKASAVVAAVTTNERQKKAVTIRSAQQRRVVIETPSSHAQSAPTATTPTVEDSSDSDEPLIEIAGKFRNTKLTKQSSSSTTTSSTTCTTSSTTTSSSTYSSSSPTTGASSGSSSTTTSSNEKEKNLRNHKTSAGAKSSSTSQNSSSSSSTNSVSLVGTTANSAVSHKPNAHSGRPVHNALSSSTSTSTSASSAISSSDDKISTRRSVRMTTSTLSTAAMNSKAKAHSNPNSSVATTPTADNPRDPAPHHAGALQSKNNHANHQHFSSTGGTVKGSTSVAMDGKTAGAGVNSVSSVTSDPPPTPTTEIRRKTRSAGLEPNTEGRRRRVSRDSK